LSSSFGQSVTRSKTKWQQMQDQAEDPRITRARLSGPKQITNDATVAELGADGTLTVLAKGTNEWVCVPGNENKIGDPPMCMNPMGMRWMMDAMRGNPKPTNESPGMIYMLCGATQRSNTNPADRTSPAIPIGPHWMKRGPLMRRRMAFQVRSATRAPGLCLRVLLLPTCMFAAPLGMAMNTTKGTRLYGPCPTLDRKHLSTAALLRPILSRGISRPPSAAGSKGERCRKGERGCYESPILHPAKRITSEKPTSPDQHALKLVGTDSRPSD
jgi:hypothetical protein